MDYFKTTDADTNDIGIEDSGEVGSVEKLNIKDETDFVFDNIKVINPISEDKKPCACRAPKADHLDPIKITWLIFGLFMLFLIELAILPIDSTSFKVFSLLIGSFLLFDLFRTIKRIFL